MFLFVLPPAQFSEGCQLPCSISGFNVGHQLTQLHKQKIQCVPVSETNYFIVLHGTIYTHN